jgi:O-succinylbenzoate synthase
VWCGGLLESGIGRAHNIALASLPNFTLPGDISASERYYREDIIEPPATVSPQGTIRVPTGPGIGVEVVESKLLRYCVRREVVLS